MGNVVGTQYSFHQQEPMNGIIVSPSNNIPNNNYNSHIHNNSNNNNHIHNHNHNHAAALNRSGNNNANNNSSNSSNSNNRPNGNYIISLGPRRSGLLDGDNLLGSIRSDLAAYFPFGRLSPPPPIHQTSTVKSLVNLHKDSVQFIPVGGASGDGGGSSASAGEGEKEVYQLQFKFDAVEPCDISVYFLASETLDENKRPQLQAKTSLGPIHFDKGTGQTFIQPPDSYFNVGGCTPDSLTLNTALNQFPVVIKLTCGGDEEDEPVTNSTGDISTATTSTITTATLSSTPSAASSSATSNTNIVDTSNSTKFPTITSTSTTSTTTTTTASSSQNDSAKPKLTTTSTTAPPIRCQITYCTLLACADGSYAIKAGLQKIQYRGQTYAVHDIFGLDHTGERENEGSRECIVCMSEPRDTTVLPCRHLCVCAPCAELMRMQTNKCPICRAPVTSLLNISLSKDFLEKEADIINKDKDQDKGKDKDNLKDLHSEDEEEDELLIARRREKDKSGSESAAAHLQTQL